MNLKNFRRARLSLILPGMLLIVTARAQTITTIAGQDTAGYSGDGGPASTAKLFNPAGVAIDTYGNVFIADQGNNRIREVLVSNGTILTVAGDSAQGITSDTLHRHLYSDSSSLYAPSGVALDASNNIYIADQDNNRILKIAALTGGLVSTIAGNDSAGFSGDGGLATLAKINLPSSIAVDKAGNAYIADYYNDRVRKVNASNDIINTIAGNTNLGDSIWGYSGDGGPALNAEFNSISAVALDNKGNIYLADAGNNRIRKIVDSTGFVYTVAGNGTAGYSGDGDTATHAMLNSPDGLAVDNYGNLFIADGGNNCIRMVNSVTGTIITVAGNGTAGFSGDGGSAVSAQLYNPEGIAFDASGNLYIADYFNSRIRMVSNLPTGINELKNSEKAVSVYPVPGNGNLNVRLGGNGYQLLTVLNALGECVYQKNLNSIVQDQYFSINLSNLSDGIYFLRAYTENSVESKPVIIQK